jgi:hypothetical protein
MDLILLVRGFICGMVFVLIQHRSLNFIPPNLGKFSYALALTEAQRLYRYHVVLVRWRVACRSRMH